jgi:hypothetical protein
LERRYAAGRPDEELYDLEADPHEQRNVAGRPENRETLEDLRSRLARWMKETQDPLRDGPLTSPTFRRMRERLFGV